MAVREFTDSAGRAWRAWDIRPESIHPQTKAEDYLADCYETGWVVFETVDGRAKRRLCPYPRAWDTLPDAELCRLLGKAEAVSGSKLAQQQQITSGTPTETPVWRRRADDVPALSTTETDVDVTDLEVVRSFRYPGGRLWSVCILTRPEDGGRPVMRFTAGARSIDLRRWPRDWPDYPDDRLVELLRMAAPRPTTAPPPPGTPRRRYDDSESPPSIG